MTNTVELKDMDKLCTAMGGAVKLDDLSDVTITSAASGNVLKYNGTKWVNGSVSEVPATSGASTGDVLTVGAGGAAWTAPGEYLPDDSEASTGDILAIGADGPEWSAPAGIWVPVPEAAEAGYVLTAKADGTVEWVDPTAEVSAKKTTKKN